MTSSRSSNLNIVYDDGDHEYTNIVRKFYKVLRDKTTSWGFNCTDEIPGRELLAQLHDNLDKSIVTIIVFLPNHDDRHDLAQYTAKSALLKLIRNADKYLIPVCLMGETSKYFELYIPLKFHTEEDWNTESQWEKLKKILEEKCLPESKIHQATVRPLTEKATVSSKAPDSIPYFMTEKFFDDTSKEIVTVWWKLGIKLRLKSNVICEIEMNSPGDVCHRAFEMLKRWKELHTTDSEQEQIVILCQALSAEKKIDMANEVLNRYKDFSKDSTQIEIKSSEPDKSIDNDIFLLELVARLPDWHGFFVLLDVPSDELHNLEKNYPQDNQRGAFQALVSWRSECGGLSNEAKMDKLIGVLQKKGRQDLVDWIKGTRPMSSEDWKMCFDANREEGEQKLVDSDIKLDQPILDFACTKLDRRSEAIKAVCKRICDDFSRQPGVEHTWPAYTDTKGDASCGGNITFVVRTDNAFDDKGYACHVRNVNEIDYKCKVENKKIKQCEQDDLGSIRELNDVQECIDGYSKTIKNEHKYCCCITPSPFKSTGYKTDYHSIQKMKCIALYVPVKGFIPLDEEPFPQTIRGFPVDVRERDSKLF